MAKGCRSPAGCAKRHRSFEQSWVKPASWFDCVDALLWRKFGSTDTSEPRKELSKFTRTVSNLNCDIPCRFCPSPHLHGVMSKLPHGHPTFFTESLGTQSRGHMMEHGQVAKAPSQAGTATILLRFQQYT